MIHVAPCDRFGGTKHEVHGTMCECGVTIDWSEFPAIVSHRFVDGDGPIWGTFEEPEEEDDAAE